ncbi:MAG: hypothetical protein Q8O64_01310, partial [Sideroxyarcus sp.]|nr:hypothetical protein [Sideroxyarcus sp.]
FDSNGMLLRTIYTDEFGNLSSTETYTYDATGMIRTGLVATDASGNLLFTDTFTFDGATGMQVIGKIRTDELGDPVFTQTNTYDATGIRTGWERTDASGVIAIQTNTYDANGMQTGVTRTDGSGNLIFSDTNIYDEFGNYMGYTTYDAATATTTAYDMDGQMVHSWADLGGADDVYTGTGRNDSIRAGDGADTITAGRGQDNIDLSESVAASDTVVINVGDSIPANGMADKVHFFDVTSGAANDLLDLPSAVIAADTVGFVTGIQSGTIMSHSIAGGMISFSDGTNQPLVVSDHANWVAAKNYMAGNIADGETIATYIDMDGDGLYTGAADRLAVFQGNATMDVQVQLYDTHGAVNALTNNLGMMNAVTII